jgi:DNA-binding beta-propeller fold protein YncE
MKRFNVIFVQVLFLFVLSGIVGGCTTNVRAENGDNPDFRLIKTIPLPHVSGRIDHLSIDLKNHRLFISALGYHSVIVLDLNKGKIIHRIGGLDYPQGVLYIPKLNKLFVSTAGNGKLFIYDAGNYQLQKTIDFGDDADNLRYDAASGIVYVAYGSGGLGLVDAKSNRLIKKILLDDHPEAFAKQDSLVFVNIPDARELATISLKTGKVINKTSFITSLGNFPLALDSVSHRLFVGFRIPPRLKVLDSRTMKTIATLKIDSDADDIYFDTQKKQIYISCGGGYLEVIRQETPNTYKLIGRIKTAEGARTSLYVPQQKYYYLAIPKSEQNSAQIRIYQRENTVAH